MNWVDEELKRTEKLIKKAYQKAYNEVAEDMLKITAKLKELIRQGKQDEIINKLSSDYFRLDAISKQMSEVILSADKSAYQFLTQSNANVFRNIYNMDASRLKFGLIDNNTARELLKTSMNPFEKLAWEKLSDKKSVVTEIKSALTTSILKGEGIGEMSTRLKTITEKSLTDCVRIARTSTTRVENSAHFAVGEEGKDRGYKMLKTWHATEDERTRPDHAIMDGVTIPHDEYFIVGGEKMLYPGDVSQGASPKNTINCRCVITEIIDI